LGNGLADVDPPENQSPSPNLPQFLGISLPISRSLSNLISLNLSISLSLISPSMFGEKKERRKKKNGEETKKEEARRKKK
jgi:hypothetical protein